MSISENDSSLSEPSILQNSGSEYLPSVDSGKNIHHNLKICMAVICYNFKPILCKINNF